MYRKKLKTRRTLKIFIAQARSKPKKMNGAFVSYHPNGAVCESGTYVNGKLQGEFKEYDENGKLMVLCYYKNHKLNGQFTQWRDVSKGLLLETALYKDGAMVYAHRYDEDSRIAGNYYYDESGMCVQSVDYLRRGEFVYVGYSYANPRSYVEKVFPM